MRAEKRRANDHKAELEKLQSQVRKTKRKDRIRISNQENKKIDSENNIKNK